MRTARSNLDPKRVVAVGAFIPGAPKDPARLARYVRETGQRPTIVSYFRRWEHGTFDPPSLRTVTRNGAIPMITWEPWGYPLADIAVLQDRKRLHLIVKDGWSYKNLIN